ncbi:Imm49 family immunity protein [Streptomyces sp. NPDC090131]|uniref:Imm49 family immunity protein n=1 Tax=unclassified Streptomyces TaxID=2593676 RepID=UPI00324DAC2A
MAAGHAGDSAVFAAADPDRETVACKIRQEERHLVTTGPKPYLTADTWLDAFYLAVICREAARLDIWRRSRCDGQAPPPAGRGMKKPQVTASESWG